MKAGNGRRGLKSWTTRTGGSAISLISAALLIFALLCRATIASAQQFKPVPEMAQWLSTSARKGQVPPGTTITMQNWRQYKQFMPLGMQVLFEGKYFWKMPSDIEMPVGPTIDHPLPPWVRDATEKYSGQVKVIHLPNGRMDVRNFTAGIPFPDPSGPDKGYEVLVNAWFSYEPHLNVGSPSNPWTFCTEDRFANIACTDTEGVYTWLNYNTDPGAPREVKGAGPYWFSEYLMVLEPEQSKYTADLTLFYTDNQRFEDNYIFVPSLRRTLRLSTTARCAPLFGSDLTHDDQRTPGFNGGISLFQAKFLGRRRILALTDFSGKAEGDFPGDYYKPLLWPKPDWGKWTVRNVDVIDVRRIPSERAGYCYGSRIMYVDPHFWYSLWVDLFDANLKLWKVVRISPRALPLKGVSPSFTDVVNDTGPVSFGWYDVQNDHITIIKTANKDGRDVMFDHAVPKHYWNVARYCTPGGLMQILR